MLLEEERLLSERSAAVARTNLWLVATTIGGVTLIVLLAAASIVLVGRSNRDRAEAERVLRETNQNLEKIIDERSGDLREANEEIQRFAYIVSHDLRSPLVNIMGFTSELEALRSTLFDELASLRAQLPAPDGEAAEEARENDTELAEEFDEAIGLIKSSISKMDRLINAILQLSRMGSREFKPESIDMNELSDAIVTTMSHQAEEAEATIAVGDLPEVEGDRLALEQILAI
jgi:signal transduction histidine kinase